MVGRNSGVSSPITNDVRNKTNRDFITCNCLANQENLRVNPLSMMYVVATVSKIDFVRSEEMNHGQFKYFLCDMELKFGFAFYYTEVRWLSRGRILT